MNLKFPQLNNKIIHVTLRFTYNTFKCRSITKKKTIIIIKILFNDIKRNIKKLSN